MNNVLRVSNKGLGAYRIYPLGQNILKKVGPSYLINDDFRMSQDFLYWFVEMPPNVENSFEFINSMEKDFLDYKGKLIFFSLADKADSTYKWMKKSILDRIDAWVINCFCSHNKEKYENLICQDILHKYILVPKYNIFYFTPYQRSPKEHKMFFSGYAHEDDRRIEPILKIKTHPILSNYFAGGLYSQRPLDPRVVTNALSSPESHVRELAKYNIALCLPGNSQFCVRHIEAMSQECSIISPDLKLDDEDWMYLDVMTKYFYTYKEDLSDFEQVCIYALENIGETIMRGQKMREIFDTFLELNSDWSYKDVTWLPIEGKFHELKMKFW